MKLTPHQKRILGALLALEQVHEWRWWSRFAIGHIVGAGGFHQTIQLKSIAILKEAGLVRTEWNSWPIELQSRVRCGCATWHWGLTDEGRVLAMRLNLRWSDGAMKRLEESSVEHCLELRDEDEPPPGWDDDDGDDGDRSPRPSPLVPALA